VNDVVGPRYRIWHPTGTASASERLPEPSGWDSGICAAPAQATYVPVVRRRGDVVEYNPPTVDAVACCIESLPARPRCDRRSMTVRTDPLVAGQRSRAGKRAQCRDVIYVEAAPL
jgi:hypothetical protein